LELLDPTEIAIAAGWGAFFHFLPSGLKRLRLWKASAASFWISRNDALYRSYVTFIGLIGIGAFAGVFGLGFVVGYSAWHLTGNLLFSMLGAVPVASLIVLGPTATIDWVMEKATGVTGHYLTRGMGYGYLHRCSNCGADLQIGERMAVKDALGRATGYQCYRCGNVDTQIHFP